MLLIFGVGSLFVAAGGPVRGRTFSSIPGLDLLDANGTSQLQQPKLNPDVAKCPWRVQLAPVVKNYRFIVVKMQISREREAEIENLRI